MTPLDALLLVLAAGRAGGSRRGCGRSKVWKPLSLKRKFSTRKRIREVSEAFCRLRACYPRTKLDVVIDNLHQVHDHPRFLARCKKLRITLVFTPTESSWLNNIEPHFGVLGRATDAGSDDPAHVVRRQRVYRYLRLRHRELGNSAHPLTRIRAVKPVNVERH